MVLFMTFPMNEDPVQECERNHQGCQELLEDGRKDLGNVKQRSEEKPDFLKSKI